MVSAFFVIWAIAGFLSLMIIHIDIKIFRKHPIITTIILLYLGPFGWLVILSMIRGIAEGVGKNE